MAGDEGAGFLSARPTLEERLHEVAELRHHRSAQTNDSGKNGAEWEWRELGVERRDHNRDERTAKRAFQGLTSAQVLEDTAPTDTPAYEIRSRIIGPSDDKGED